MKKILTWGLYALLSVSLLAACKKEKDVSPNTLGGTYNIYEIDDYESNKVIPIPSQGLSGEVIIKMNDETHANLRLVLREEGKDTADADFACKIKKDSDGGFEFLDAGNKRIAYAIEYNDIDVYLPSARISARK